MKDAVIGSASAAAEEYEENPHKTNLNLNLALHRLLSFPAKYLRQNLNCLKILAEIGLYYVNDSRVEHLQCYYCSLILHLHELTRYFPRGGANGENVILDRQKEMKCRIYESNSNNVPMGKNISSALNFKYEAHRLYSLLEKADWRFVGPFSLARSGFYYTGSSDNVRCVFCNLEVRGWEQGDTAEGEHRRWNCNCPFLTNSQGVGNVAIGREQTQIHHDGIGSVHPGSNPFAVSDLVEKYGENVKIVGNASPFLVTPQDLNIQNWSKPLNSRYATLKSRFDSFAGIWPRGLKQTPNALLRAGFFYTGVGDRVICFYCNLGLKDWDPNDDPFVQHCKWNATCQYLLMCKGPGYVKQILQGHQHAPDQPATRARGNDDLRCLKCRANNVSKVNLPCGHVSYCSRCREASCPVCQSEIIAEIKLPGFSNLTDE